MEICPLAGIKVAELGAGTGRVTRLLSVSVEHIYAFDEAQTMLDVAAKSLEITGMTNWTLQQADNREIPLPDNHVDLAIEGWSFAHVRGWYPETWRDETNRMLAEMERVTRPDGTIILIETMGTGNKQPQPPTEGLAQLYQWWEQEHGFQYKWIRTDYQFKSVEEADELTRFFFGDERADDIVEKQLTILPECTGVWWKKA
jgi:ubiquinone/menaquinone biosynthesis C-methylase UbiE